MPAVMKLAFPTNLLVIMAVTSWGSTANKWNIRLARIVVGLACVRCRIGRNRRTCPVGLVLPTGIGNWVGI